MSPLLAKYFYSHKHVKIVQQPDLKL